VKNKNNTYPYRTYILRYRKGSRECKKQQKRARLKAFSFLKTKNFNYYNKGKKRLRSRMIEFLFSTASKRRSQRGL
jgi:hypothetical protein